MILLIQSTEVFDQNILYNVDTINNHTVIDTIEVWTGLATLGNVKYSIV